MDHVASNAVTSESQDAEIGLSPGSSTSSPVHCSHGGQTVSTTAPSASPVFSTSLIAESSRGAHQHHSSPPPVEHSPTPVEDRPQPALFSPPTDMDTDVSAIIGQAAEDSELWRSDVSFEASLQYSGSLYLSLRLKSQTLA